MGIFFRNRQVITPEKTLKKKKKKCFKSHAYYLVKLPPSLQTFFAISTMRWAHLLQKLSF